MTEPFTLWTKGTSFLNNETEFSEVNLEKSSLKDSPLIQAFLEDEDIQQITICSTNLGIVRTFQKRYKEQRNG